MKIAISPEEYQVLTGHAAEVSAATRALASAAVVSRLEGDGIAQDFELICDPSEAQALFSLAQAHCPSALPKIEAAARQVPRTEASKKESNR